MGFWASALGTAASPGLDTIQRIDILTGDGSIFESALNPIAPPRTVTITNNFNRVDDEAAVIFAIRAKS